MIYLRLFFEFFKTGLFSIGGGLATLPFLYQMQADTGWFSVSDLSNLIAVSESTPGPMGVNMATYTGYVTAGIPGSVIAVAGLVCPSIIIIMIVYNILAKFKENKYVKWAMYGLKSASAALIFCAGLRVAQTAFINSDALWTADMINFVPLVFGIVLFIVYKLTGKHPIIYIVAAGIAGIVMGL